MTNSSFEIMKSIDILLSAFSAVHVVTERMLT
jgi:hypothetical protein